jgi:translation elongation factor EF-G
MEALRVVPDLEVAGFEDGPYDVREHVGDVVIGGMSNGTAAGKPVVMIGLRLEDGSYLVTQTTLVLFLAAADALRAKYEEPA